jgi:hypothetical protein
VFSVTRILYAYKPRRFSARFLCVLIISFVSVWFTQCFVSYADDPPSVPYTAAALRAALNAGLMTLSSDYTDASAVEEFDIWASSAISSYTDACKDTIAMFDSGNARDIYRSPGWPDYKNLIKYITDNWSSSGSVDFSDGTIHRGRYTDTGDLDSNYFYYLDKKFFLLNTPSRPNTPTLTKVYTLLKMLSDGSVSRARSSVSSDSFDFYSGLLYSWSGSGNSVVQFIVKQLVDKGWAGDKSASNAVTTNNVIFKRSSDKVAQYVPFVDFGDIYYAIPWGALTSLSREQLAIMDGTNPSSIMRVPPNTYTGSLSDVYNNLRRFLLDHYDHVISDDNVTDFVHLMNTMRPSGLEYPVPTNTGYRFVPSLLVYGDWFSSPTWDEMYLEGMTVLAGRPIPLASNTDGSWGIEELPTPTISLVTSVDKDLLSWIDDSVAMVAPGYEYSNGVIQDWGYVRGLSSQEASLHNIIPVSWVKMSTPGIISGDDIILAGPGSGVDSDTGQPNTVDDGVKTGEIADIRNPRPEWGKKFPLSLPWDIQDMIHLFNSAPVAPKISGKFPLPSFLGHDISFTLDMSGWKPVSVVLRVVLSVLLSFGLILSYAKYVGIYGGD